MEQITIPPHPDRVFGQEGKEGAIIKRKGELLAEVRALAASLEVPVTSEGNTYEPDAFVLAIRHTHDKLMEVKTRLVQQNEEQRLKATELKQREDAVAFREKRIAAHETIARRSWWKL
jgi:hypothetical protein